MLIIHIAKAGGIDTMIVESFVCVCFLLASQHHSVLLVQPHGEE